MIKGIPKISVLIITYKQEYLIKRAINSLLAQKDYIYEICVSDDCSPDNTWGILQVYDKQHAGLFNLHRNERNVGIFENIEYSWCMPSGDIVYHLSGDDACGENWFKTVIDFIQKNKVDYKNELFCIYGDYQGVDPRGKVEVHRNNLAVSRKNHFSLSLRGIVGNRSSCYSVNILRRFFKVSQGRSHIAESSIDRQLQLFAKSYYYIPNIGNIYYSGVGVSTNIVNDKIYSERKPINKYMVAVFSDKGYAPTKSDIRYMAYDEAFMDFLHEKSLKNGFRLFCKYLMSIDFTIGIRSLNLQFIFSHLTKI